MNVRELLGKRMLFFDGGMGSMLQKNGMGAGEIPELLNLTNAALIEKIHTEYLEAGANIITTNTLDRKSTRLNSSHRSQSRMPSSA